MCGRYVARKLRWADYAAQPAFEEFSQLRLVPRFNIAPSQPVPVVRLNRAGDRVGDLIRWGLIPSWTKGKPRHQPINARSDTVATSGMFSSAFERRRCLQLADGFYEWKRTETDKQPYLIKLATDAAFAFAAIWERWRPDAEGEPVDTVAHITVAANGVVSEIHDRMPVILHKRDYDAWLDPNTDPATLLTLLQPLPAGSWRCTPSRAR